MNASIRRLFDLRRFCGWTGYAMGAKQARLMGEAYPQQQHATAITVVERLSARENAPWANVENPSAVGSAPRLETTGTQFEALQIEAGERAISRLMRNWERKRYALAGRFKLGLSEVRRLAPEVAAHKQRHAGLLYARPSEWPLWIRVPVLLAFALPEYPLTRSAFEVFRLARVETQLTAAGAALVLIFLADYVGQTLRQRRWGWVPSSALVMLLVGLTSLAALRTDFLEQAARDREARLATELAVISSRATGAGAPAAAAPVATAPSRMNTALPLGALAALFVVAGVVLAFRAHHHDPELLDIVRARRTSERQLQRLLDRIVRAAAAHDGVRGAVLQDVIAERERVLMVLREWRWANEMWRLPAADRPAAFAETVDERLFKTRDFGVAMLPLAQQLESLLVADGAPPADTEELFDRLLSASRLENVNA
jgi:hypothetical protein